MVVPTKFSAISICSGTGMLDHGLNAALGGAVRQILYVERDAAAAANMAYQMENGFLPPAPIWSDLKTVGCAEVREYIRRATGSGAVDILTGGIPCQPWSQNGSSGGAADARDVWPEFYRAVKAYEPSIVFIENVDQIVNHRAGAFRIQRDLEKLGYRVAVGLFQSDEVGGPHRRRRCYILAVADSASQRKAPGQGHCGRAAPESPQYESIAGTRKYAEHDYSGLAAQLSRYAPARDDYESWRKVAQLAPSRMPPVERELCGMDNGVAGWSHRLRLIGNGVDPLVAGYAFVSLWACLQPSDSRGVRESGLSRAAD